MLGGRKGWLALCYCENECVAVVVTHKEGKPVVESMKWFPLDLLAGIKRELNAGNKPVITLLNADEYQLLPLEAPNVPDKELMESVRWQIRDQLAFSAEDAGLDILHIPRSKHDSGRSVYAVAADGKVIRERTEAIEQAHFNLAVIDIPEMAQRNLASLFEQNGDGLAMLAADEKGFLLTITMAGELCMTRRIGKGAAARLGDWSAVVRELERSLQYFTRQFAKPISRLILAGCDADGLQTCLTEQLDVPVELLRLADVIDIGAVPELADASAAARALPAIGAAMRQGL